MRFTTALWLLSTHNVNRFILNSVSVFFCGFWQRFAGISSNFGFFFINFQQARLGFFKCPQNYSKISRQFV